MISSLSSETSQGRNQGTEATARDGRLPSPRWLAGLLGLLDLDGAGGRGKHGCVAVVLADAQARRVLGDDLLDDASPRQLRDALGLDHDSVSRMRSHCATPRPDSTTRGRLTVASACRCTSARRRRPPRRRSRARARVRSRSHCVGARAPRGRLVAPDAMAQAFGRLQPLRPRARPRSRDRCASPRAPNASSRAGSKGGGASSASCSCARTSSSTVRGHALMASPSVRARSAQH